MEQHAAQGIARILRADQMRERERYFLGWCKAILAIEDHAVAAIEHKHSCARAKILGLMHVEVGILLVEGKPQALALQCGKERGAHIQVEQVTKLIGFGTTACIDAGSKIACVMSPEARLSELAQQVFEGFIAEEINRFICHLKAGFCFRTTVRTGSAGRFGRLSLHVDVASLFELSNQIFKELFPLAGGHLCEALPHLFELIGGKQLSTFQGALDCLFKLLQGVRVEFRKAQIRILKTTLQEVVGECPKKILCFNAEIFFGKFRVRDPAHRIRRSVQIPSSATAYIATARIETAAQILTFVAGALAAGGEAFGSDEF